jgi:superfamily II DNA or RNA helicase
VNRKKGAFHFEPRKWQAEFLEAWEKRSPDKSAFMLVAVPGGGKTKATLEACRRWKRLGTNRKIVVVVPSITLQEQWRKEAMLFGLDLLTSEFGANFKDDFDGGVTTYQSVFFSPEILKAICFKFEVMVVMDECHHCGDKAGWGEAIKEAFVLSKERLLMSGTAWRSDGTRIPFADYDQDGFISSDFEYKHEHAIRDGVIRTLSFDYNAGGIINNNTGDVTPVNENITEAEEQGRLAPLLRSDGVYVREQIAKSHKKLLEVRKTVPDAAALALCMDQDHADAIAKVITAETGCYPSVIVSDTERTNDSVEGFTKKKSEWLVAVRKVSEGTDIKRLQVLCYLTNYTSDLFFRQAIGRVSRVRNNGDPDGYVYLPATPRLLNCVLRLEQSQVIGMREREELERLGPTDRQPAQSKFSDFSTQHDGTSAFIVGRTQLPVDVAKRIEYAATSVGISMTQALEFRKLFDLGPPQEKQKEFPQLSKEERMKNLRTEIQWAVSYISRLTKEEHGKIHARYVQRFGKPQEQMKETELELKLQALKSEIERAQKNDRA